MKNKILLLYQHIRYIFDLYQQSSKLQSVYCCSLTININTNTVQTDINMIPEYTTITNDVSTRETSGWVLPALSAAMLLYGGGASAAICGPSGSSSLGSCEREPLSGLFYVTVHWWQHLLLSIWNRCMYVCNRCNVFMKKKRRFTLPVACWTITSTTWHT